MRKFIAFKSCIRALLAIYIYIAVCYVCLLPCSVAVKYIRGTCVVMKATCKQGHERVWYSQPMTGKMPLGNLIVASGIL